MKKLLVAIAALALVSACGNKNTANSGAGYGSAAPGSTQDFIQTAGDRVFFALNSSSVDAKGRETLAQQARWLNRYPQVTITVEGHSDERGTRDYNIALGARRAQAVKTVLIQNGVASSRIKTVSYGKEKPIVAGQTEQAWSINRRGVTVPNL